MTRNTQVEQGQWRLIEAGASLNRINLAVQLQSGSRNVQVCIVLIDLDDFNHLLATGPGERFHSPDSPQHRLLVCAIEVGFQHPLHQQYIIYGIRHPFANGMRYVVHSYACAHIVNLDISCFAPLDLTVERCQKTKSIKEVLGPAVGKLSPLMWSSPEPPGR